MLGSTNKKAAVTGTRLVMLTACHRSSLDQQANTTAIKGNRTYSQHDMQSAMHTATPDVNSFLEPATL